MSTYKPLRDALAAMLAEMDSDAPVNPATVGAVEEARLSAALVRDPLVAAVQVAFEAPQGSDAAAEAWAEIREALA